MRPRSLAALVSLAPLAVGLTTTARATASLDETLDVSLHVARTRADWRSTGSPAPFDARGFGVRVGSTRDALRYGAGIDFAFPERLATPVPELVGRRAWVFQGEAFVGYAPGGYWHVRPNLELRAHADRLWLGQDGGALGFGVGPRLSLLVPIDEYFFVDVGVGRDLVGPEQLRATVAIGLPIPLSHL